VAPEPRRSSIDNGKRTSVAIDRVLTCAVRAVGQYSLVDLGFTEWDGLEELGELDFRMAVELQIRFVHQFALGSARMMEKTTTRF
jgi:hypothetical protein